MNTLVILTFLKKKREREEEEEGVYLDSLKERKIHGSCQTQEKTLASPAHRDQAVNDHGVEHGDVRQSDQQKQLAQINAADADDHECPHVLAARNNLPLKCTH